MDAVFSFVFWDLFLNFIPWTYACSTYSQARQHAGWAQKVFPANSLTVLHITWHFGRCVSNIRLVASTNRPNRLHLKIWQETGRRWGQVSPQCMEDPDHEGNSYCWSGSIFSWRWKGYKLYKFIWSLICKSGGAMWCIQFRLKLWLIEPVICAAGSTPERAGQSRCQTEEGGSEKSPIWWWIWSR